MIESLLKPPVWHPESPHVCLCAEVAKVSCNLARKFSARQNFVVCFHRLFEHLKQWLALFLDVPGRRGINECGGLVQKLPETVVSLILLIVQRTRQYQAGMVFGELVLYS